MRISLQLVHLCFSSLPVQHHRQHMDRSMAETQTDWKVCFLLRTFSSSLGRVGADLKTPDPRITTFHILVFLHCFFYYLVLKIAF